METLVIGAVIGALVLGAIWWISRDARIAGAIKRHPTTAVRNLRAGMEVKVVGKLERHRELLEGPLTGRPCVAWRVSVAGGGEGARVSIDEQKLLDFVLSDETGSVVVHVSGEVDSAFDNDYTRVVQGDIPERLEKLVSRHGARKGWRAGRLSIAEGVLEVGETVAVMGAVQAGEGGTLVLTGGARRLRISDRPDAV
jgi:hypothetical protein